MQNAWKRLSALLSGGGDSQQQQQQLQRPLRSKGSGGGLGSSLSSTTTTKSGSPTSLKQQQQAQPNQQQIAAEDTPTPVSTCAPSSKQHLRDAPSPTPTPKASDLCAAASVHEWAHRHPAIVGAKQHQQLRDSHGVESGKQAEACWHELPTSPASPFSQSSRRPSADEARDTETALNARTLKYLQVGGQLAFSYVCMFNSHMLSCGIAPVWILSSASACTR